MKGALFFISFFLIFAAATYMIPTPMFPGSLFLNFVNSSSGSQTAFMMALLNGITYGMISWTVFALAMRKIGGSESEEEVVSVQHEAQRKGVEVQPKRSSRRSRSRAKSSVE